MKRYSEYTPQIADIEQVENNEESIVDTHMQDKLPKNRKKKVESARTKKDNEPNFVQKTIAFLTGDTFRYLLGIIAFSLGAYLLISFISFLFTGIEDQSMVENTALGTTPVVKNEGGESGARLSRFLINDCFGIGSIMIIIWLFAVAVKSFSKKVRFKIVNFTIKSLIALITISLVVGFLTIKLTSDFNWGGLHGREVNQFLIDFLGTYGAVIACIMFAGIFVIVCLNDIRVWILKIKRIRDARRQEALLIQEEEERRQLEREQMESLDDESSSERDEDNPVTEMSFDPETDPFSYSIEDEEIVLTYVDDSSVDDMNTDINSEENTSEIDTDEHQQIETEVESSQQESIDDVMKVNVNQIQEAENLKKNPDVYDPTAELSRYKFPPYNLLKEFETRISVDEAEQLGNKEMIRKTLLDFDIPIVSIEATVGPTVTLYEIVPDKGIKINKIRNLADDIALRIAATGVRIIAPIPGKGTIGIEVANKDPQTVSMKSVLTSKKFQDNKYELPIAIGSTISNEVFVADLAKMPHLLVAGATGQGKSVGLNAIITSLLYSKHPAELKFVLIDPKMVEFSLYSKLEKHYLAKIPDEDDPIIIDPQKVVATLNSLCQEMDDRYMLLKKCGTRSIKEYNAKFVNRVLNPEKGHRFLPYIVVIVDEFSDLIMTAGKEVESPIMRIAQKARAVGIHMIIATQRPSTNVITGNIKANFPARMAFRVISGVDSKTILDTVGAQHLIGRGDLLLSTGSEITRVQCAFIDTPEVESICDFISNQVGYNSAYLLPEPIVVNDASSVSSGEGAHFGDRDELFEEIARLIVSSNTASTSSLQRRYNIGYNRAGRIMDQLEAAGVVGPAQGGKPRSVLVDAMTLESILNG